MFAPLTALPFRRKALAQIMALCLVIPLCTFAARPFLETLDWGQVRFAWHDISALQWITTVIATICSFAALGKYDVTIHRVLNTGVDRRAAQASGAASVALSQTLGLGLVTGTLARWRALDGIGIVMAGSVTTLVSLSFLGAWLILFALAGLMSPNALPLPPLVYMASLFSALCFILYTALKRYIALAGYRVRLPSLRAITMLIIFAAVDTGFATLTFWILLPSSVGIEFSTLFPIYLACLGISLVGNTPGGVGPFEITLLWALQFVDVNEVLASLIAFRIVYFVLPACVAMAYLVKPIRSRPLRQANILLAKAMHPETASGLQTGRILVASSGHVIGTVARTTQSTVMMFDPALSPSTSLAALKSAAQKNDTSPLFYKCSARPAAQLRRQGLKVARIAQDALIDLSLVQISSPKRRTLRRKIRAAQKAAIVIKPLNLLSCSIVEIEGVDLEWQKDNGTPRGFSMGRVCPNYLATQVMFGAWLDDKLVAFTSCHQSPDVWTLDIMRNCSNLPSGTMHALVWFAIERAKDKGLSTFSLASTIFGESPALKAIDRFSLRSSVNTDGFEQFKRAFAPRWHPLYAAAPNKAELYLGLWDVWQEVQDPPPIQHQNENA